MHLSVKVDLSQASLKILETEDFVVELESADFVAVAAAAAVLLVVGPVAVALEPLKQLKEILVTSVRPEGFQVATSLHLLNGSEMSLETYCH